MHDPIARVHAPNAGSPVRPRILLAGVAVSAAPRRPFILTTSKTAAIAFIGLWTLLAMVNSLLVARSNSVWGYLAIGAMVLLAVGYAVTLIKLVRHPELVAPVKWSLRGRDVRSRDGHDRPSEDNPYRTS